MCSVTASHAEHNGFDSRRLHNRQDWLLSPVTQLLEDKVMGNPGLYNLVEL